MVDGKIIYATKSTLFALDLEPLLNPLAKAVDEGGATWRTELFEAGDHKTKVWDF